MTNAFLEALQVLEKMLCSKVRWQLCICSESHLDTRPWKRSTNLARATRYSVNCDPLTTANIPYPVETYIMSCTAFVNAGESF